MSIPGADGLIRELPHGVRRTAYAALTAGFVVAGYFMFVDGRIAVAETRSRNNSQRIDGVQADIKDIKAAAIDLREKQAANGQKLDDVKGTVDAVNAKLDQLLLQRRAQFP